MDLAAQTTGHKGDAITLLLMPFLGGSFHEWASVIRLLEPRYRCIGVDMPGFGEQADRIAFTVSEMAEHLALCAASLSGQPFLLVGHSMSGKVAAVAARLGQDGDPRFGGLLGLILVAASPPSPEPMSERRRQEMIANLGHRGPDTRQHAERYITENSAGKLPVDVFEAAVDDVLRMNPAAWNAWLNHGSREDWSERVGILGLPTLIVAAEMDPDLGAGLQRAEILPHFRDAQLTVVSQSGHLIPMDRPEELAGLIDQFVHHRFTGSRAALAGPNIDLLYRELIDSPRVSEATRRVLLDRARGEDPSCLPRVLAPAELRILRALADRLLPQTAPAIDLAARLDERLASAKGKGWRYAELPPGPEAYRVGLAHLDARATADHGCSFVDLTAEQKDALLRGAAAGDWTPTGETAASSRLLEWTGSQMAKWIEDVCAELTGIYVAHPATLARMGYSGIADGEDSHALSGFVELGLGKREPWEPLPTGAPKA